MAKISQEERKLNFSSKEYPVFKKMATELAKDYDSRINRDELAETLEALKPKMGLAQYKENGMDENQMAIDIALDIYGRFAKMFSDRTSNQSLKADIKRLTEKRIEYRKDIKREYQERYEKLNGRYEGI